MTDGRRKLDHAPRLTIDLAALAANWRALRDRATPAECGAAVKADAYGIGLEPAVRALTIAGCRTFFVAHLGEAERARAAAPDATIYVLNGLLPGTAGRYAAVGARPVVGSGDEVRAWAEAGAPTPFGLHADTGMNRLGLPPGEATAWLGTWPPGLPRPALLMSHLASAEDPDDPAAGRQATAFEALRALAPDLPASLANSAGCFRPDVPGLALVRPGYALYGGNPTPGRPNPMRPVVRLEAPILQLRDVPSGDRVGYNGRWTARRPTRLATLSLGYADGFRRAGSGTDAAPGGAALVAGVLCPVVGTVSMDLTVLDVTDAPRAERGDAAVLIGDGLDLEEVGRRAGTIGYEVLTGLAPRLARTYLGG